MKTRALHLARFALAVVVLFAAVPAARAAAPANEDCLACHRDDPTISMQRRGKTVSLFVKAGVLEGSAHAKVKCIACHAGFNPDETPHLPKIPPVRCEGCHKGVAAKHVYHAALLASKPAAGESGPSCKGCHGTHDVQVVAAPVAGATDKDLDAACGRCHKEQVAHYEQSAHGRAAAAGQAGAPRCRTCHDHPITRRENGGVLSADVKIAQEKLCLSCHLDDPAVRARMTPGAGFIAAYDQSVHGKALHAGNAKAATCADCHGSHEMAKGFEPASKASKQHISATCGACHAKIASVYDHSVHGAAVAQGSAESPSCTDCHGEHSIRKAKAADSPVAPANVSEKVCSPCHSSVRLTAKYGIKNDRFKTFSDSFHGLAIRGGSVSAANCASCHGSHDILPSSDPRSRIAPGNLAATCGKCHPGADAAFAKGKVHLDMTEKDDPLLYWVALIYTLLIVVVIGGMFVHNAFDFWRKARHQLAVRRGQHPRASPGGPRALPAHDGERARSSTRSLLVSFVVLVLTGFALRYPEAWVVESLRRFSGTLFDCAASSHRVAGVVLVLASHLSHRLPGVHRARP